MSFQIVIGAVLLVGPVILVACIAIGLLGYNPRWAESVRHAEAREPTAVEEVRRIHVRSPDRFRDDRLDRHPLYLFTNVSVWCYGWSIFVGAPVTSNLTTLDPRTKLTMAACFIIGSTLALSGAAMGVRVGRWTLLRGIRDNLTSSMLADDIRLPYSFGAIGVAAVGISMAIYSTTSFGVTIGSLGGWLTSCGSIASAVLLGTFVVRIRRYERARVALVNEAVSQIERRGHVAE